MIELGVEEGNPKYDTYANDGIAYTEIEKPTSETALAVKKRQEAAGAAQAVIITRAAGVPNDALDLCLKALLKSNELKRKRE